MEDEPKWNPLNCKNCGAHEELEDKFNKLADSNKEEHYSILANLSVMTSNINWMKKIGSWLLVTMLGYFVAIGIYIFSADNPNKKDVTDLKEAIESGERLHWKNDANINLIKGKLEIILQNHTRDKQ